MPGKVSEPDGEYQKQDGADDGGKVEDEDAEQDAGEEAGFLRVLWSVNKRKVHKKN